MTSVLNNISTMYNNLKGSSKTGGRSKKNNLTKTRSKKLKRGGGESEETYTCGKCVKNEVQSSELPKLPASGGNIEEANPTPVIPDINVTEPKTIHVVEGTLPTTTQTGGKVKSVKGAYKKYLNKFKLSILQKEAKRKGIKITTKKNGKITNIKKASLINKITAKKFSK